MFLTAKELRNGEDSLGLKVISLFTGVGGLDFGFETAGFDTRVALDMDPVACRTLRLNRSWPVIEADLGSIDSKQILDAGNLRPGETDVLIGGPPCQPFSKSGYWATGDAKRLDDPRADTLTHYLRVLRDTLPKAFLLENVAGLAYRGKSEGIEAIQRGVAAINASTGTEYALSVRSLNAAEYGVPQLRERIFVIGSRDGVNFRYPDPTHFPHERLVSQKIGEPYRTAWDALGDLDPEPQDDELLMSGKWADLLPTIPEGQNYLWHTERGGGEPIFGWRRRYWSFLLKLSKRLPSWTIQAQPGPATGPFHWRNRKLSPPELGRLQTFPDGIIYDCRRSEIQKLIGNAVPSALGELLAREISVQLVGKCAMGKPLTLIPPRRVDSPKLEAIHPLPHKYRSLVGDDDEHPGTGKGRRATSRTAATV
ncbi:MAG: DNA cytosine methyltransferase [Proteobacteria bacterium]|nr:DNA cytosine methyltransferase [Pseudomonadota bacterium]